MPAFVLKGDVRISQSLRRTSLVVVALASLITLGRKFGDYLPYFTEWVESLGILGPGVFISGYIIATVALVPGSLLTLAAGAIFGVVKGTIYVSLGATLGASVAFLISRYLGRSFVERQLAKNPRFAEIDRAVKREGRKIVLLLRLSPVFPFNLLNYSLGLTNVRFTDYVIASVGMLPGTMLYVYYGRIAGDVLSLASGSVTGRSTDCYIMLIVGLAATIFAVTVVTRTARRALREPSSD